MEGIEKENTRDKCKGKFARLCVELDLTESLVSQYSISGFRYKAEYEGSYNICFSCAIVGHEKANCPKNKNSIQSTRSTTVTAIEGGKKPTEKDSAGRRIVRDNE
ncbi:hypothetical protein Ahy_B06g084491 [Arachis hypogaea]|uniref:CCHC-type domain-containing protein n=1 Tax=Arachis hypogaea TaxID=3818 RepID=A0A444YS30_ARAHY|nr:hypothetical protein Ahy_B06g084491 [Arachis hypogaea]